VPTVSTDCVRQSPLKKSTALNASDTVRYKVLYHVGDSITLSTKAASGWLSIGDYRVMIQGAEDVSIPFDALQNVELFRLHGTGRMLKIQHTSATLFVTVIRFNLFGFFAAVNFFKTGRLQHELAARIPRNQTITEGNSPALDPDARPTVT
jgi:hypothetical protein